jgi:hypothetical protein
MCGACGAQHVRREVCVWGGTSMGILSIYKGRVRSELLAQTITPQLLAASCLQRHIHCSPLHPPITPPPQHPPVPQVEARPAERPVEAGASRLEGPPSGPHPAPPSARAARAAGGGSPVVSPADSATALLQPHARQVGCASVHAAQPRFFLDFYCYCYARSFFFDRVAEASLLGPPNPLLSSTTAALVERTPPASGTSQSKHRQLPHTMAMPAQVEPSPALEGSSPAATRASLPRPTVAGAAAPAPPAQPAPTSPPGRLAVQASLRLLMDVGRCGPDRPPGTASLRLLMDVGRCGPDRPPGTASLSTARGQQTAVGGHKRNPRLQGRWGQPLKWPAG